MLDANLKTQLKAYLEKVSHPIEIVASLDDGAKSREMQELLQNRAAVGPHQAGRATRLRRDARTPSFTEPPRDRYQRRFAAIPMGHEFTSLVLALLQVGGHPIKLDDKVIEQIKTWTATSLRDLHLADLPELPGRGAGAERDVHHQPAHPSVTIDGALFQGEVEQRQIMAVPTVYLNGEVFGQGRTGVEEILAKLDTGAAARKGEELSAKEAVRRADRRRRPAGAAAAIYAARKGIRTGVVAERFGGQVLDTLAIENFISVQETEGPQFATALEQHVKAYDVDIMNVQRAEALVPGDKLIEVKLANGGVLKGKTVILSTGARWRNVNVPGEQEYKNKGVAYCPHCDGPLFKGKRVSVIGGGNSGVEAAIDLAGIVAHVTLIEFAAELKADAVLVRKLKSLPNVTIVTSAQTTEITGDGQRVNGISYKDRDTGEVKHVALEGVFVQIGLVPNTEWLKGTLACPSMARSRSMPRARPRCPACSRRRRDHRCRTSRSSSPWAQGARCLSAFDHLIRSSADDVAPAVAKEAVAA
jgi:alkyl hydroperoxide reductase subunit F